MTGALQRFKFIEDNKAIAYGYFVIALFIIAVSAIYIFFLPMFDGMTDLMNEFIGRSEVSQDTANVLNYDRLLLNVAPVILLIGLFLWGIVRAREERTVQ